MGREGHTLPAPRDIEGNPVPEYQTASLFTQPSHVDDVEVTLHGVGRNVPDILVKIPGDLIRKLVAAEVLAHRISALKQATPEEILGLPPARVAGTPRWTPGDDKQVEGRTLRAPPTPDISAGNNTPARTPRLMEVLAGVLQEEATGLHVEWNDPDARPWPLSKALPMGATALSIPPVSNVRAFLYALRCLAPFRGRSSKADVSDYVERMVLEAEQRLTPEDRKHLREVSFIVTVFGIDFYPGPGQIRGE